MNHLTRTICAEGEGLMHRMQILGSGGTHDQLMAIISAPSDGFRPATQPVEMPTPRSAPKITATRRSA